MTPTNETHSNARTPTKTGANVADPDVFNATDERPVKPASVILNLLRTYAEQGTSVTNIMATGAMFGFSDNRMRVGLSRLVAKRTIENFSRGCYRLTSATDQFNAFIEQWRLGESRVVPWGHRWLLVHRSRDVSPTAATKGEWALTHQGFRETHKGCWIRPDNLALDPNMLEAQLRYLGLEDEALLASDAKLNAQWQQRWLTQVTPERLLERYRLMSRRLTSSLAGLPNLNRAAAMKASFQLGGQAIEMLSTDPLLPAELLDTEPRESLWRLLCNYDRVGRELWAGTNDSNTSSTHTVTPSAQAARAQSR
jgi:phenylacetic acid degradation operon negative regulatory protein